MGSLSAYNSYISFQMYVAYKINGTTPLCLDVIIHALTIVSCIHSRHMAETKALIYYCSFVN